MPKIDMPYSLDYYKSSRYFTCPNCGQKRLKPYCTPDGKPVDVTIYGRCQREIKCGYNRYPDREADHMPRTIEFVPKKVFYLPDEFCKKRVGNFEKSNLFRFFQRGKVDFAPIFKKYLIGGNDFSPETTFYFQFDGKLWRSGKSIKYGKDGHRLKGKGTLPFFLHRHQDLGFDDNAMELRQCFFGQHLLDENSPVVVVESEKTALYCNGAFPKYIWLATGGRTQLNAAKLQILGNRVVYLIPDTDSVEYWSKIANTFGNITTIDLREVAELEKGADLMDYFCDFGYDIKAKTYYYLLNLFNNTSAKPAPNQYSSGMLKVKLC